ncbi:exonuclease domain-containing protein [Streptomyces cyaneofuscatus]|uniref:exonuclease domain-containing protein n=1 Tax=Streptomyces cyaneofuscatus TaxID=66883 RepID=UPI0036BD1A4F
MTLSSPSRDVSGLRDYAFDWALVDVETSGVIARRDRVLSVAVVTIGPDGKQTGEFSTLLNPGCDPGPVHVHGLTAERLLGAPTFEQVAGRIGALLQDRVMVAHNAQFDYDFLANEFARARLYLPVSQRLCTLALNRQVDPPAADMKLGTLAAHYGVPQTRAHDAATARAELVARSVAAGLNVMSSVSRHTSALVTNEAGSTSTKARRAAGGGRGRTGDRRAHVPAAAE